MKNTIITIASLVIVLFVVAYGYELVFKKSVIEAPVTEEESSDYVSTLEIKEQYKNGTYTFVGTIQVPTPCHSLISKANKLSDTEYQIELTTVAPKVGVVCAQVITDKTFKVSFQAPKDIVVSALLDGIVYEVNRFVIPVDQNIDTFILEIKG